MIKKIAGLGRENQLLSSLFVFLLLCCKTCNVKQAEGTLSIQPYLKACFSIKYINIERQTNFQIAISESTHS